VKYNYTQKKLFFFLIAFKKKFFKRDPSAIQNKK